MRTAAFVLACALHAAFAPAAQADPVTLAELIATGGSITSGGYVFSDFRNLTHNQGSFSAPQFAGGGPDATVTASGPGLVFTGDLAAAFGQTVGGGSFQFTVTAAGGPLIGSESVSVTGSVSQATFPNFSPPSASGSAGIVGFGFTNPSTTTSYSATKSGFAYLPNAGNGFQSVDVTVSTSAYGYVSRAFDGYGEISSITFSVGSIPEPGSLTLALAGAAGLALRLARPKLSRTPKAA